MNRACSLIVTPGRRHLTYGAVIPLLLTVLTGCGGWSDFYVHDFSLTRDGWGAVQTGVTFYSDPLLGSPRQVQPDSVYAHVFTTGYDTLYAGTSGSIPIDDTSLGDAERLLIEVCGISGSQTACEQRSIAASPKRVDVDLAIDYPVMQGEIERGSYRLDYRIERQRPDSSGWETVTPSSRVETYFEARVVPGTGSSVRIPADRRRNRFNLSRYTNFRDFRFDLNSSIMDADTALVQFDLFARIGRTPVLIATEEVVVRRKSEAERRAEVGFLTELAARQVLDRLKRFYGLRRAYVFINEWSYIALERVYRVETELHWQDAFRGSWSDLTGELLIRSDGSVGSFRYLRGSESAEERWADRMDSTFIQLDPVIADPYRPIDEEDDDV